MKKRRAEINFTSEQVFRSIRDIFEPDEIIKGEPYDKHIYKLTKEQVRIIMEEGVWLPYDTHIIFEN